VGRRDTAAQHDRILRELHEERASALTRISRTLESLIGELHALRASIADVPESERDREITRYHVLRKRALKYRWYLEVQREALGLHHHNRLDEFYPIPPDSDTTSRT
jgi:hypothetical protein